MTGQAGAAIAAEHLTFEESPTFEEIAQRSGFGGIR
jgi:hypothetical protein